MNSESFIRRLKYKATRRSTLEMDQLMRRIVDRLDWAALSERELAALDAVLDLEDLDLQPALLGRGDPPEGIDREFWLKLLGLIEHK